ncbi:DUF2927 domain-containing protein [Thiomicrorhabdus cannonii]|uniref:DUF2927 domain-containing protein n=1 Tax=Thiomicrorhabdus cannonii TaxID=2748011 RepID=UPI0015B7DFAB|nr:DUF2927 domain-containing protein [Thiomicrorhabdus cannonii]
MVGFWQKKRAQKTQQAGYGARRRWWLPGLLSFVSLFSAPIHADEINLLDWRNPLYLERAFIEIAMKNEYRQTDMRLHKWQAPILYQFEYHTPYKNKNRMTEKMFDIHFEHLHRITGHPIRRVKKGEYANLTIVITQDRLYKEDIEHYTRQAPNGLERDSHCIAHYQTDNTGAIDYANIILPLDHVMSRGLLATCVVEESTQIMGLPNDSDWVNPSIANDKSKIEFLTGLDYTLLKILYSSELQPGMPLQESQPKIRHVIHRFERDGTIDRANQEVNRYGLYPLLN